MTRNRMVDGLLASGLFLVVSATSGISAEEVAREASASSTMIPNFSGSWARDSTIMQLFPQSTGASGLINISGFRLQGIANYDSPILIPWAAEIVRHQGELIR